MIKRDAEEREAHRNALPLWVDLSAAVDSGTLLSWIQAEVAMLSWNTTERYERIPLNTSHGLDVRSILHLLCFSYAAGLYSSDDIIRACRTNAAMHGICGGMIPFAQELQTARRRHRMLLEKVLAAVILRALLARPGIGLECQVSRSVAIGAAERLNLARHLDSYPD